MIERLAEQAVLAAISSCAWIVLVLVLRPMATRRLGARWAYALWSIPLLGLMAMLLPAQALKAAFDWPTLTLPLLPDFLTRTTIGADRAAHTLDIHDWARWLAWAWVAGAMALFARFLVQYLRGHLRAFRHSRTLSSREHEQLQQRLDALARRYDVEIRMLTVPQGPAVTGIVDPRLYLPSDFFQRFSQDQQSLILAHELHHIRRRDVIVQMAARLYRCLFWFNPLAWVAERGVLLDQEISCDEHVLRTTDDATRRNYGQAMLLAAQSSHGAAHAGYSSYRHMRRRAAMLREHRPAPVRNALGATLLILAAIPSIAFGLLGSFEPRRDIRPTLLAPMAEIMGQLQCGKPTEGEIFAMLERIEQLRASTPGNALSSQEQAGLHGMAALAHHRLGDSQASLTAFQVVAKLSRGTLDIPPTAVCEYHRVYLADQPEALEVNTR
ncbi:hypothetical protein F3N42_10935 [Marinihelvus fidelis]|uniref:Peptidase M56 domain-containing protein n=1 Tax=Marinihelvus fidelis TaxID=2613842 RepID=A0A5N0T7E0_9GAMM|nr:M56 family metallopeptidase [Marinihelvus fidelis]KAA9130870.1 hypothetical protein F3N42_10935 [Marinihelvus fidelis]